MLSREKKKRTFSSSVKDCLNGFKFININEDNFKREIFLGIIALLLSYILKVSKIEFIIVIIMIALVFIVYLHKFFCVVDSDITDTAW